MTAEYDFDRVTIEGYLTVETPLCIGAGSIREIQTKGDDEARQYLEVCLDHESLPYLPGSSIRGLLAALGATHLTLEAHRILFGLARGENNAYGAGALRVYDAPLAKDNADNIQEWQQPEYLGRHQTGRSRAAIDPVTGTAKDQHLFNVTTVPAGRRFQCLFELDKVNQETATFLLGLLNLLDGQCPEARLGKGASRLEGRVKWCHRRTSGFTPQQLANWLLDSHRHGLPYEHLTIGAKPFNAPAAARLIRLPYFLYPQAPLLADPVHIPADKDKDGEHKEPDMRFRRDAKGRLLLSAAGLRGLLRQHCRKILMTLLVPEIPDCQPPYKPAQNIADELIGRLFGHTGLRGAIRLSDAVAQNSSPHAQTFNAIDRFTGGVAQGALYSVEAAMADRLTGDLYLDKLLLQDQTNWWCGLLWLALRDGMEGDFAVGWGKAKGYGAVKVGIELKDGKEYRDWAAVMANYGEDIREAVSALDRRLQDCIKAEQPTESKT